MSGLGFSRLVDMIASHAMQLGVFDKVNLHEPKSAPGSGVNAAVWVDLVAPFEGSGLAATSVRVVLKMRVYLPFTTEPQDQIDPQIVDAVDAFMAGISGDFDLGGLVRNVDLLGQGGEPMTARAGYIQQDSKNFRIMEVTIPLILNDVWEQVA